MSGYNSKDTSDPFKCIVGVTKVLSSHGTPLLLRTHSGASKLLPDGTCDPNVENLLSTDQLHNNGLIVDSTPHKYGGAQCIIIPTPADEENVIIPLVYVNGHCTMEIATPTPKEMNTLPLYDLTKDDAWYDRSPIVERYDHARVTRGAGERIEAILDIIEKNERDVSAVLCDLKVTKSKTPSTEQRKVWKSRLNISDENVLTKTLEATTQLAITEYKPELTQLKQHAKRRLYSLGGRRIKGYVSTDPIVPKKDIGKSWRGYQYSQVFLVVSTGYIFIYHMKHKNEYSDAFHAFFTEVGIPEEMRADYASEEKSKAVVKILHKYKVKISQSEPYHQHQNFVEHSIKDLKYATFKILSKSGAPIGLWDYALSHAGDLLNITARRSIGWRASHERTMGGTPDISKFLYFDFFDPLRYTTPNIRFPLNPDQAGRYLGVAHNTGDELTYKVMVDEHRENKKHTVVVRSAVSLDRGDNLALQDRRIHPLKPDKSFKYTIQQIWDNIEDISGIEDETTQNAQHTDDQEGHMPLETLATQEEREIEEQTLVDKLWDIKDITGHKTTQKGRKPYLQVVWTTGDKTWEPFQRLKEDVPEEVAQYVTRNGLGAPYQPTWAKNFVVLRTKFKKRKAVPKYVNGVELPKNIEHALRLDGTNGNNLWKDAIDKEMDSIHRYEVFQLWKDGKSGIPPKDKGWQRAPLRMIFAVKNDGRRKARLVLGGHMTEAEEYDTYADTVNTPNVRLLLLLGIVNLWCILGGDVNTAYLNAVTKELIYVIAGLEFGAENVGKVYVLYKALYGAKGSANAWYHCLGDFMRSIQFKLSRIDGSFWYRLNKDTDTYDYFATHVDDYLTIGVSPQKIVDQVKGSFTVTAEPSVPETYLGMNIDRMPDSDGLCLCARDYIKKVIPLVEDIAEKKLGKHSTPNIVDWRPSEDETPLLNEAMVNKYQRLLGIANWLVTICRLDITYAVNTLARYTHVAREGHWKSLLRVFEYLNKVPFLGIPITAHTLQWIHPDGVLETVQNNIAQLKTYYPDVQDEWDSNWPAPKGKPVTVTIFVDADHASNRSDRRSITGIIILINKMPYKWFSKRQTSVEASTFGAEYSAARVAVEEAIAVTHMLRSIGVPMTGPVDIFVDNKAVVQNSTMPGSALKKKNLSIAFHILREAQAAGICRFFHVAGDDNPSDIMTKSLPGPLYKKHVSTLMIRYHGSDSTA